MLRNHQEKSEVEKEEEEEAGNHGEGIVFPLASLPVESAIRGGDAGRTLPSTSHVPVELNAGLISAESCSYWKKRGGVYQSPIVVTSGWDPVSHAVFSLTCTSISSLQDWIQPPNVRILLILLVSEQSLFLFPVAGGALPDCTRPQCGKITFLPSPPFPPLGFFGFIFFLLFLSL